VAPWAGADCGVLDALPAAPPDGALFRRANTSSWCASTVRDDAGVWHAYVSVFADHCGLNSWQANSQLVHAVSAGGPTGPYVNDTVIRPPFSHNPKVVRDPVSREYLLFHIGCGDNQTRRYGPCAGGVTPLPSWDDPTDPPPPCGGALQAATAEGGDWGALEAVGAALPVGGAPVALAREALTGAEAEREPEALTEGLREVLRVPVERKPNGRPLVRRVDWERSQHPAQNDTPADGPVVPLQHLRDHHARSEDEDEGEDGVREPAEQGQHDAVPQRFDSQERPHHQPGPQHRGAAAGAAVRASRRSAGRTGRGETRGARSSGASRGWWRRSREP
jgi:hypothetical protein